jgi:hypothetical protein
VAEKRIVTEKKIKMRKELITTPYIVRNNVNRINFENLLKKHDIESYINNDIQDISKMFMKFTHVPSKKNVKFSCNQSTSYEYILNRLKLFIENI